MHSGISILFAVLLLCSGQTVYPQPASSPWPMWGRDARHTSQSSYEGPDAPRLQWRFSTGASISSSPALGSDGTITLVW